MSIVTLNNREPISPDILQYINRLSDYLFVLARLLSRSDDGDEIQWKRS